MANQLKPGGAMHSQSSQESIISSDFLPPTAVEAEIRLPRPPPLFPRGNWNNRRQFLLACISVSVGLGNVWRFPYTTYTYGGGAFLVSYIILLVVIGQPLYYLEIALSQYSQYGPIGVWECVPAMKGIGYATCWVCIFLAIYYNVILAYSLFYMTSSFASPLPWSYCHDDFDKCYVPTRKGVFERKSRQGLRSAAEHYWEKRVLGAQKTVFEDNDLGPLKWDLVGLLFFLWVLVYFSLMKGIRSSGKVIYFTALFPYVVLFVLAIVGFTLEGAGTGLKYLFYPDFGALIDARVWYVAAEQVMYSLGVCAGNVLMLGSYCSFRHPIAIDAYIVTSIDLLTSVLAGIVVFSILGAQSVSTGIPIDEIVHNEEGILFVAFPEAIVNLPASQLWSILFFFMVVVIGFDNEIMFVETVLTAFYDRFEHLRDRKWIVSMVLCIVLFLLGLPCVTRDGSYVVTMMDNYVAGRGAFFVAVAETATICYLYGIRNFVDDITFMLGKPPYKYMVYVWLGMPFVCTVLFFVSLFSVPRATVYGIEITDKGNLVGWLWTLFIILQVPGVMLYVMWLYRKRNRPLKDTFYPGSQWGPGDEKEIKARIFFRKGSVKHVGGSFTMLEPTLEETSSDLALTEAGAKSIMGLDPKLKKKFLGTDSTGDDYGQDSLD